MMSDDAFQIMQEKHVLSIVLYLAENGPSRKSDIYEAVSRGTRMPDKLDGLERSGIVRIVNRDGHGPFLISLTEKGERVGELVSEIKEMIDQS